MKHTLWIGVLLCLLLVACGTQQQPTQTTTQTTTQPTIPATIPTEPETTVATIPEETVIIIEEEPTEETIIPLDGVDGETLYHEDKFALVFQDLSVAQLPANATKKQKAAFREGWELTMVAANKTDMPVYMRLMNLSVNSYMFENLPTVMLDPGEYRTVSYILTNAELDYNGITEIEDLQFNLWVYESEDFLTPDVADGLCKYYVNHKKPVYPKREHQPEDQILVENERYSVTVTGVTVGEDVQIQLHLENFSDKELLYIAPYGLVNEQVLDPLWAYNVSGGKQRNTVLTFTAEQLQTAGIEEVLTIMMPIQIGDHRDWSLGAYFYENFDILLPIPETEPEITEEIQETPQA